MSQMGMSVEFAIRKEKVNIVDIAHTRLCVGATLCVARKFTITSEGDSQNRPYILLKSVDYILEIHQSPIYKLLHDSVPAY